MFYRCDTILKIKCQEANMTISTEKIVEGTLKH